MSISKPKAPTVLFVGDYNREDYVALLKLCKGDIHFKFLHFSSGTEEKSNYYRTFGNSIYWKDYTHAHDLLLKERPAKVVFLYIDTYFQVALNLACQELTIPTFHLEHGMLADYGIAFNPAVSYHPPVPALQRIASMAKKITQLYSRIKSKLFLHKTIRALSPENAAYLKDFITTKRKTLPLAAFRSLNSRRRLAESYISFSANVFKVRQKFDALPPDQKVTFIGVPYFDHLAGVLSAETEKAILLVDQPLAEQGLFRWNKGYKQQFMQHLITICEQQQLKLYVKPHPLQQVKPWLAAEKKGQCILLRDDDVAAKAASIPVVLGFYSTYLMPFAAFEHTTILTFENHPAGDFLVSRPFVDAGVAHPVYKPEDLEAALANIKELHQAQLPNKKKFEEDWLYKFDGRSGERLRNILLAKHI
ncbi:polysialyltransferase family glycosyltransferase [Pontibacter sp. SGAir0037]|uniref:polysialyltransferase family glycosyltransferase n=1 Tax=Pontibacter sp. SGAir0037 TaxID=2571030 RepID=UPI0010CD3E1A|nr:polysialyltransferase family glycosyltransferase [Pontibacter sp. SGAir0037]QCR24767.1 hypothetical protein C1N53_22030 [Pontibacter sp. SGAir0037]